MSRPARIETDVAALRHNHRLLRRMHGGRVLAVLKADAHGHGAERCANALAGSITLMTHFARADEVEQRDVAAGEAIGYGARFVADRATCRPGRLRAAGNGTPVAVDKQRTALVGRVSMDMSTVDLTDLPSAGIGSEVECGAPIPVDDIAASAGTVAYELLCNAKRAPRVTASRLLDRRVEWRHGGKS